MIRTRRTSLAAVAATATLGLATGLISAPAQAAAPQTSGFAFRGWGYGTASTSTPATSSASGWESIGCTNKTGLTRTNNLAKATIPGLGTADGLSTKVSTSRQGKVVSTQSTNTIGQVKLSDSPLGSLVLDAVSSTSRAYHDGTRFRAATSTTVAKVTFQPPVGPAQSYPLPSEKREVVIPGFAKIELNPTSETTTAHSAQAVANGLRVTLTRTKAVVKVARSVSQISDGVVTGIFSGNSYAVGGKAGGDVVSLGRNPLQKLQCQGTAGEVQTRTLAATSLGNNAVVKGLSASQRTVTTSKRAVGYERATVASFSLGDNLQVSGIVGQVNVRRGGKNLKTLKRGTTGTQVGTITVNGQQQSFPSTGVLEIPGVAKLQQRIVTKSPNGLKLTALRITLLNGSGAVIDLGNAYLAIRRATK